MPAAMPENLGQIRNSGRISADDTLVLRRVIYPDGHISANEAEWLFDLNAACPEQDPAWHQLFIEALTDYVVNQIDPAGYVTAENASWLITRIGHDGKVDSATELELLVNILDKAKSCPPSLSAYALEQVRQAVISGEGPLRHGRILGAGRVTAGDVDLLRRTLYAAGGQANVAITREEADILFAISDATANGDNDPSWSDLFAKAIANHVMFASGYAVPTREEALRREAWRDDTSVNVSGFFARMASGLKDVISLYGQPDDSIGEVRARSMDAAISERVTEDEATWLAARITRNGQIMPHEAAVLSFIKQESPDIHPALKPLLDKVA
jgi:hypothetical protein